MNVALFITPANLKAVSVIDENVDEKIIQVCIKEAQDVRIHRILGTTLYQKYITDINTSGSAGVTGVYRTLMNDYIQNALVYWTLYEISVWLNFKYRNKMIATQSSDNAQPVDLSTVQALRDEHKIKAEWYTQRLVDYLCENSTSYPEYDNNPDGDDIQSQRNNFESPIFTPGSNDCCLDLKDRYNEL